MPQVGYSEVAQLARQQPGLGIALGSVTLLTSACPSSPVFRAKSQYLDIKIKLLREMHKKSPTNPAGIRPLGSHLKVDQHGVIWDGEKPVGIWGLDSEPTTPAAR